MRVQMAEVIAKQAVELSQLHKKLLAADEAIDTAIKMMICIGGPLNDNVLEFNKDQKTFLNRMYLILKENKPIEVNDDW